MADSHHFFMAMEPPTATKQEARVAVRNGKPVFYPSPAWQAAESKLAAHLERHRPDKPIRKGVGVILSVEWCFPSDGGHADGEPHTDKPDTDNLDKGLKDIMTRLGWWEDDCQVFGENIVKLYGRVPGIRIDIDEVPLCH